MQYNGLIYYPFTSITRLFAQYNFFDEIHTTETLEYIASHPSQFLLNPPRAVVTRRREGYGI